MTREQLEHLIRAAADISNDDEIVVIGSQALLAQFPDAPESLRVSMEADVFPRNHPERADLIDGTIGELSPFHDTYGYYAHGVSETTAILPSGWRTRLVLICNSNTRGATGLCLEVHDLAVAKAFAGRDRDQEFLQVAARHALIDHDTVRQRLDLVEPISDELRSRARDRIDAAFKASRR